MRPTRFYIKDCLQWLCQRLAAVSDNVFAEHRPTGVEGQMADMVVVSLPVRVADRGVYQFTLVNFSLLARDRQGGVAHTKRLQEMMDGVTELLPLKEGRFLVTRPRYMAEGTDGSGFTEWTVQAELRINTSDRVEIWPT